MSKRITVAEFAAEFDAITDGCKIGMAERIDYRLRTLSNRARTQLGFREFLTPSVYLFTGRKAAGLAHLVENRIGLNKVLLEENVEAMLGNTLAHELAHLVTYQLHDAGRLPRIAVEKSHGVHWQRIMRKLGEVPSRTHRFDMSNVAVRRQKRWLYTCDCREFKITTTKRNKVLRGEIGLRCPSCRVTLTDQERLA